LAISSSARGIVCIRFGAFRFSGISSKLIQLLGRAAAAAAADADAGALGGSGGGLGDFPWLLTLLRPPSGGTLPANFVNVFAIPACCRRGLFSLKLSSRGRDIFIRSTRRSSNDVCITNSSSKVGFIGVVERGLSIGIVLEREHLIINDRFRDQEPAQAAFEGLRKAISFFRMI